MRDRQESMKGKHRKEEPEKGKEGPAGQKDGANGGGAGSAEPAANRGGPQSPADSGERSPAAPAADVKPAIDDRLLRLQADFDNYRKRTLRERSETAVRANEDLMRELLPVLDHLDLALDAAVQHHASGPVIEGVKLVCEQLLGVLGRFGLRAEDAGGQGFDPSRHEAISHLASDDVPANRVMTQVRRGYWLGERLLRPAQVVVSSGPAGGGPAGDGRAAPPAAEG